jgi:HEAT repeat protein
MKKMLLFVTVMVLAVVLITTVLMHFRKPYSEYPTNTQIKQIPAVQSEEREGKASEEHGIVVGHAAGNKTATTQEKTVAQAAEVPAQQVQQSRESAIPANSVDETAVKAAVAELENNDVPTTDRSMKIKELATKGDATSVAALMKLGDEDTYLNYAAVEELGTVANPAMKQPIVNYMRGKLAAQDLKVLAAAIKNLGKLLGSDAVPLLAEVIRQNRVRGDGFELMVLTGAVETLGQIGSADAVPILMEELGRSEEKGWSLAYGSDVVEALGRLNTPAGKQALIAYADRLQARRPNDPLAGPHFDKKIAEARQAAGL